MTFLYDLLQCVLEGQLSSLIVCTLCPALNFVYEEVPQTPTTKLRIKDQEIDVTRYILVGFNKKLSIYQYYYYYKYMTIFVFVFQGQCC